MSSPFYTLWTNYLHDDDGWEDDEYSGVRCGVVLNILPGLLLYIVDALQHQQIDTTSTSLGY